MPGLNIEMTVQIKVKKEGVYFIASCPVLDVHSQGRMKKTAVENLVEALQLFMETCFERGTLDEVLKDAGLHVSKRHYRKHQMRNSVSIPICLA